MLTCASKERILKVVNPDNWQYRQQETAQPSGNRDPDSFVPADDLDLTGVEDVEGPVQGNDGEHVDGHLTGKHGKSPRNLAHGTGTPRVGIQDIHPSVVHVHAGDNKEIYPHEAV